MLHLEKFFDNQGAFPALSDPPGLAPEPGYSFQSFGYAKRISTSIPCADAFPAIADR
jgi:hypothetical protein